MSPPRHAAVELAAVLVAAWIAVGRLVLDDVLVPGSGVDLSGTLWTHWWVVYALTTGVDPGATELFFFPLGKAVFAHTGLNVLDGLLSAPFQLLFGHPGYLAPFCLGVLVANGWAFRSLVREAPLGARVVGSCAFVLAPFALDELGRGRVTQACLFWLPLALGHFLRVRAGRRHAVLAGAFTAVAGWTYWFYGYFLAFCFAWLAVHELARGPQRAVMLRRFLLAGGVCGLLVAPGVLPMLAAASAGDVPLLDVGRGAHLLGLPRELQQAVFGAPVLIALALWLLTGPDRLRWAPLLVGSGVLALGPSPEGEPSMAYAALVEHVPFFSRFGFPYRFLAIWSLGVAVALSGVVARSGRLRPVAAVAGLVLVGQVARPALPVKGEGVVVPDFVDELAAEGGALIDMPVPARGTLIALQPHHQLPLWAGMGADNQGLWPDGFLERTRNSFIVALREAAKGRRKLRYAARDRQALRDEGFRWVGLELFGRRGPSSRAAMIELLGEPRFEAEGLVVFDLDR